MFPNFLPPEVNLLKDNSFISHARSIKRYPILTNFSTKKINTAYIKVKTDAKNNNLPILLLHSLDSSTFEFCSLLPFLAKNQEVWVVDLFGFGFTERLPNIPCNINTIRNHLYYFWQTLINKPVLLVGYSMGGATAIDFTLHYPEAVKKLILVNSVGYNGIVPVKNLLEQKAAKIVLELMAELSIEIWRQQRNKALFWGKSLNLLNTKWEDIVRCAVLPSLMPNWRQIFKSFVLSGGYDGIQKSIALIKKPTLILWGEEDKMLGTKVAYKFQNTISNSQLIWIPKASHFLQIEQPEVLAKYILLFAN